MHDLTIYGIPLAVIAVSALYDLSRHIIPNKIIVLGLLIWIVLVTLGEQVKGGNLLSGLAAALFLLGIRWIGDAFLSGKGMGMGDIKLVFIIGLYVGWQVFWFLYLAFIVGGLWALVALALKKVHRDGRLAFAPFLFAGTCIGLILLPFGMVYQWWL